MFPYDISINLIRNADHTRIHKDVGYHGEEEFTCLVYMNPTWDKNFYGETTFFEKNSDDTEIVAQVRPRYGRLVIFDGECNCRILFVFLIVSVEEMVWLRMYLTK